MTGLLRSIVPPGLRSRLRRSGLVNRLLRARYGGIRSAPHPFCDYELHFDGYRNLGWSAGGLEKAEAEFFDYARKLMDQRRPACVWDVGANVGLWSLFFAAYRPTIQTIACFEPDPINRKILQINVEKNGIKSIQIRPEALSDKLGKLTFMADPMTGSTGTLEADNNFIGRHFNAKQTEIQVDVSTVDAIVAGGLPAPDFMKIDVEGHELPLFRGAIETLRRCKPAIIFEATRHQAEVGEILTGLGYTLYDVEKNEKISVPTFGTAAIFD